MTRSPTVRVATVADAAPLATLCDQLGYPSTEAQVLDRLDLLGDPERTLLVAVEDAGVIGFIDVHVQRVVESDPYGEVGGLVIADGHRGAGAGRLLLEAAADWCRDRRLSRLWIRANLARTRSHDFYLRAGCGVVKDQRVYEYPL